MIPRETAASRKNQVQLYVSTQLIIYLKVYHQKAVRAAALRANTRNPSAYCVESPALPDAVESDASTLILMIGYNPIVRIKILD